MCVHTVHELHAHEYAVAPVVPTIVPFKLVEKHVFGEVHAVPYTSTAICCTTWPLAHGSLNVQQLCTAGQSYSPLPQMLQLETFQQSTTSVVVLHGSPHPRTGVGANVFEIGSVNHTPELHVLVIVDR